MENTGLHLSCDRHEFNPLDTSHFTEVHDSDATRRMTSLRECKIFHFEPIVHSRQLHPVLLDYIGSSQSSSRFEKCFGLFGV
ncbi:hypothetical protein TNCV_4814641 [Trichonephila clavipes]|nr:hypothetical protein TNCV_4814641 [Trichonephila clavipes]